MRVGDNFIDQATPERRESIKEIFGTVVATSKPVEYDTTYASETQTMHITVTVTPVITNGKTIGICVTAHDITKRKNLEIERQNMITDLIQKNRDLEQFAYILSHNVRGPLSTMLGLHALLREEGYDESLGYIVDGIGQTAERLDMVIRDLNEILHIRRDVSEQKHKINLYDIVQNVKASINQLIVNSNAAITCDFDGVYEVQAIRSYALSIFYNLILNAIKFAKPGTQPNIRIRSEKQAGQVGIYFTDNGMGIDVDRYSGRIFGLYQRFHPQIEGKGLGLFTVKTQVEMMHGKIEIQSSPGTGAMFKIILPD